MPSRYSGSTQAQSARRPRRRGPNHDWTKEELNKIRNYSGTMTISALHRAHFPYLSYNQVKGKVNSMNLRGQARQPRRGGPVAEDLDGAFALFLLLG